MKKLTLTTIVFVGLAIASFGQGQLVFANGPLSVDKIYVTDSINGQSTTQMGSEISGSGTTLYTFALFYNSITNSTYGTAPNVSTSATPWTTAGWSFAGDYATNALLSGRVAPVDADPANGYLTVNGLGGGINANLEVIGWNTAVGGTTLASFESAYVNGVAGLYYGYSGVGNIQLGDGVTVAAGPVFGPPNTGLIGGFTLAPAPEPATIALAGLGCLSLLVFRRKR